MPKKPRGTDPNAPAYVLPGNSALHHPTQTQTQTQTQSSTQQLDSTHNGGTSAAAAAAMAAATQKFDVSDINAVPSVVERPQRLATRSAGLDVSDIEVSGCVRARVCVWGGGARALK